MDYNTLEGIKECLTSYKSFTDMIQARREAYYRHKQSLDIFYVLGRYNLDGCGNVGVATNFIPAEKIDNFPLVVGRNEFWALIHKWEKENIPNVLTREEIDAPDFDFSANKRPYPTSITFSMEDTIPPARICCSHCGDGWNTSNCHDVKVFHNTCEHDDKDTFVGKTLEQLKEEHKDRSDAIYVFRKEMQNKKYIDLTPHPKYDSLKVNERGNFDAVDGYVIEKDDIVFYDTWIYRHRDCVRDMAGKECEEFLKNNGEGYMQGNLAGRFECDYYIKLELMLAGIDVIKKKATGEVPYNFEGKLGKYTFSRAWYYWCVDGPVPLSLAKKMYEDEEGKKTVRVQGHCGCPPPEEWARPESTDRKIDWKENGIEPVITSYHIDSWQGLKLFADTVREIA